MRVKVTAGGEYHCVKGLVSVSELNQQTYYNTVVLLGVKGQVGKDLCVTSSRSTNHSSNVRGKRAHIRSKNKESLGIVDTY